MHLTMHSLKSFAGGSVSPDNQYRNGEWGADTNVQHENPAKYLLYRPTASQVLAVLATAL